MKRFILIHYGEVGLKKGNKEHFVDQLRVFIRNRLQSEFKKTFKVVHSLSRFFVYIENDFDEKACVQILKEIPGIENFQFVFEGSANLEILGKEIWSVVGKDEGNGLFQFESFCVRVKRSMKFEFTSQEAERYLGAVLFEKRIANKVDLNDPKLLINVEILNNHAYFSFNRYSGMGGLPPGSGGRLIALISAGIDSPVAAYRMMKRGARVDFVHFEGYPYTDDVEVENVKKLVKILSKYQVKTRLHVLPFGKIQKSIATNLEIPGRLRVILYRRLMLRIAEKLAVLNKCKGLVTGDSYGQVASQTLENMVAIHAVSKFPLFQPLISFDKQEIISVAREIGTYDISKLPCKDTCSMFVPKSPEIRAVLTEIEKCDSILSCDDFTAEAIEGVKIFDY